MTETMSLKAAQTIAATAKKEISGADDVKRKHILTTTLAMIISQYVEQTDEYREFVRLYQGKVDGDYYEELRANKVSEILATVDSYLSAANKRFQPS